MDDAGGGIVNARVDAGEREDPATADAAIAALYDRIAATGAAALATGAVVPDPLPSDGDERWGISAVFVPAPWPPALARVADELAVLLGPAHVVYRPDALHVTLRQFEGHRSDVPDDDGLVQACRAVLGAFAAATRPVVLTLRGLVASSTGIVVKGWPGFDLQAMRRDLQRRLEAAGVPMAGPERGRGSLRRSAHASLAIFGGALERPAALAAFVARHADTDFGRHAFDHVRLVGFRRTHDSVALIEHGRFAFA